MHLHWLDLSAWSNCHNKILALVRTFSSLMQRNKGSIQQIVANLLLRLQLSLRLSWSAEEYCTSFMQLWIFCTYVLFHDETARVCTYHLFLYRSLGTMKPCPYQDASHCHFTEMQNCDGTLGRVSCPLSVNKFHDTEQAWLIHLCELQGLHCVGSRSSRPQKISY